MGLGVTDQSAELYMLNHQNIFAHVTDGSRRRAVSHTFSPAISWFDCLQNITCERSRKYHPLPTTPCSRGILPVTKVACTGQVTAGVMVRSAADDPSAARALRWGVSGPRSERVRPTTLMTAVGCNDQRPDVTGSPRRIELLSNFSLRPTIGRSWISPSSSRPLCAKNATGLS